MDFYEFIDSLRTAMRMKASMIHHGMASVSIDGKRRTLLAMFTIKEEDSEIINWDIQR